MDDRISYCGLNCNSCPIHMATLEQDLARQLSMRVSIARECTEHYGMNLLPGEINDCDGCLAATGRLFTGCINCGIRKCAIDKRLNSCALCDEYPCKKLAATFELDPDARIRLEQIRRAAR